MGNNNLAGKEEEEGEIMAEGGSGRLAQENISGLSAGTFSHAVDGLMGRLENRDAVVAQR